MNKPAVTKAKLNRAIDVLTARGLFAGLRLHPDGSVDLLTANGNAPLSSEPLDDELEAFKRTNGYD